MPTVEQACGAASGEAGVAVSAAERWSAVAAVASGVAAIAALIVTLQERDTPYKTALYSARWGAIADYSKASANLSTVLARTTILVPATVGDPHLLAAMSDREMLNAAKAARPAIDAWGEYIAASSAAGAPWSIQVNQRMAEAEGAGRAAYECYRRLGAYVEGEALPPDWLKALRGMAAGPCKNNREPDREAAFDTKAELVLRAMTDELRLDDDQFVPGAAHNEMD